MTSWEIIPRRLGEAWGAAEDVVAQVVSAQASLFMFIRIQDDLLDRQRTDLEAQFTADGHLVDSLEALQELPQLGGEFWRDYRRRLRDTVAGILDMRALEYAPGAFREEHLPLHARVAAIFGVGVSALAHVCGRVAELEWIHAVQARLAVFSQICDDIEDLDEDVAQGRYTWVANVLGDTGLMDAQRCGVISARMRAEAAAVRQVVPLHAPASLRELSDVMLDEVAMLERVLHEARVRAVFGEVLSEAVRPLRKIGQSGAPAGALADLPQ